MSRIVRRIRSRGYELDAQQRVSASTMLRYLEHMRWESAHDPQVNLGQMFEEGFRMVIRAQQLELTEPVGLEEELDISMELGHVGGASMDMLHEVFRVADGQSVARAVVTAVLLSPSFRPQRIPDEIRALVPPCERQVLVPPAEEPGSKVWSRRLEVMPSDLDLFRHVNHARYLDYFNDTRLLAARAGGYGSASEQAGGRLLRVSLDYRQEALVGNGITASTWLLGKSGDSLGFEMRRDDAVLARCRIDVAPDGLATSEPS